MGRAPGLTRSLCKRQERHSSRNGRSSGVPLSCQRTSVSQRSLVIAQTPPDTTLDSSSVAQRCGPWIWRVSQSPWGKETLRNAKGRTGSWQPEKNLQSSVTTTVFNHLSLRRIQGICLIQELLKTTTGITAGNPSHAWEHTSYRCLTIE